MKEKIKKIINPQRWVILEELGNQQQKTFKLAHLNPEVFMDSEKGERNKIIKTEVRGKTIETTSTYGIITRRGRMSDFYEGLESAVKSGLITALSLEDIQRMRQQVNQVFPEEYDYWTDITIINYQKEEIALQAFKNISSQFTKGLAQTIVPGTPNNTSFAELLKNPLVIAEIEKQGEESIASFKKISAQLESASEQMVKNFQASGFQYEEGEFNKHLALYLSLPEKKAKPLIKEKKSDGYIEIKNPDGSITKIKASGGSDDRVKFPPGAFKKEGLPLNNKVLQAILVKNMVVSGGLLGAWRCAPSGQNFCQSLTKFKTITKTSYEDGYTYINHLIVPLNSTLEKEAYLNREEIEKMISKIITLL